MTPISNKKTILFFSFLFILFLSFHFFGLHIPYHQDEYKWPHYANPEISVPGIVPHPPLTEFLYRVIGYGIGYDNFRFIPFFFGILNFFLIFYLAKIIFEKRTALWVLSLFTFSFYSLLASLMVDVDGAVMPFFFLIFAISYFKLKEKDFDFVRACKERDWANLWWIVLPIGAFGGFLIKVSAILPVFAFVFDFLIWKGIFKDKKRILKYGLYCVAGLTTFVLVLFLSKLIFPFFRLEYSFKYWEHFVVFKDRGWFQTFIQFAKSILYLSPLLVLPLAFLDRDIWRKTRPFFFFIFLGLFFYLFAFDFSVGALDRYFQFLIVPLCIISGAIFSKYFYDFKFKKSLVLTCFILSALVFGLQFFNHSTPPLYPKTEWVHRLVSLKWNFLFPFTGGSGPLGFYVSFLFIAIVWIVSAIAISIVLTKPQFKKTALFFLMAIGIIYNGLFIEEYLFGNINGSASKLVRDSVSYISKNPDIKKVIVYNDNGGYDIQKTGKYERRLYASPAFEQNYKTILSNFDGHILYINIPTNDPNSFYGKYLSNCKNIYQKDEKKISAIIYDCRNIYKKY